MSAIPGIAPTSDFLRWQHAVLLSEVNHRCYDLPSQLRDTRTNLLFPIRVYFFKVFCGIVSASARHWLPYLPLLCCTQIPLTCHSGISGPGQIL